jgi:hypothetical protein
VSNILIYSLTETYDNLGGNPKTIEKIFVFKSEDHFSIESLHSLNIFKFFKFNFNAFNNFFDLWKILIY